MTDLFLRIVELSWQAGVLALAVMLARLALRRAPKWAVCLLWALVAVRLVLPFSLQSPVSLQAAQSPVTAALCELPQTQAEAQKTDEVLSSGATEPLTPRPPVVLTETVRPVPAAKPAMTLSLLAAVWLAGVTVMLTYLLASYLRIYHQVRTAVRLEDNVYRCGQWGTPFVLGLFRPRIYVPEDMDEADLPQVLAHERCHIRRGDHAVKPLAFLLLAVHWFNPVLWAAYILLGRDMENACDERVLRTLDSAGRAAYSRALVACAVQERPAAVCPLAFGEVAVKERVKNVLGYKKPAIWAAVILAAAAVVIGVCLLTKPSYKNVGTLDAEKLFALRTPYVDNNSAVGAILDALGFRELGSSGADYGYAVHLSTDREPMGITVLYTYEGAVPRKSEERYRQIAMRGYIALALIDNAEWLSWQEHGADGTSNKADSTASDSLYPIVYPGYPDTVRESAEGLQAYINMLQEWMKDGIMLYARAPGEQDRWAWNADFPDASDEITPWPTLTENDPCSVRAEDYGIVYDAEKLPDWETVPLSYLCAYYLNADGAYAEGAMDVLAQRYQQAPNTVKAYLRRLAGQQAPDGRGDAAEVLLADISRYAMSQLTGGLPVAASYERDQLSISVSEVYSVTYRTVTYDENYSEDIPVYEVGSGAQLSVIKGEGFTLYGRYNEENVALHNGDVVELTEQFVGLGMDGQYAVRFQYRSAAETAELEVYQITWEAGDSTKQVVPLTEEQVQAIQSEKGLVQPEWHQVCATLHRSGEDDVRYWGTADYPVPPTVLKILTEQCGYTFVTPADFRGNMTSAKLEFYGGETYTAAKADLPALQKMLTNARAYGGASSCGFGAKLTVTFDDGRTVSVLKGTDSCASFMFGSWSSAMVSDSENRQFWQMFGVPFEG